MTRRDFAVELFAEYPAQDFSYNPAQQLFFYDGVEVPLDDFQNYKDYPLDPTSLEDAELKVSTSPMVSQFGDNLHIMPTMSDWLVKSRDKYADLKLAVADAMVEAYVAHGGDVKRGRLRDDVHTDFHVTIDQIGHPSFWVHGDCACLCVAADGVMFDAESWPEGIGTFVSHNVGKIAEKAGLMAGAGTLAYMCKLDLGA